MLKMLQIASKSCEVACLPYQRCGTSAKLDLEGKKLTED